MIPTLRRWDPADTEGFAQFLASDTWPMHVYPSATVAAARERVADAGYGTDDAAWWVEVDGQVVGTVRVELYRDTDPTIDIRLRSSHRGRGLGEPVIRETCRQVFALGDYRRIEGQTRCDNVAMRTVFRRCGFALEAVYRQAWPLPEGGYIDSVGYALLRSDWEAGTVTPVRWADEDVIARPAPA